MPTIQLGVLRLDAAAEEQTGESTTSRKRSGYFRKEGCRFRRIRPNLSGIGVTDLQDWRHRATGLASPINGIDVIEQRDGDRTNFYF